jgi:dTDP-4-amino-4,6-dideoxygalactose transaminase
MLSELEKKIAAHFDREYCLLVGSGTAALFVVLQALDLPPGSGVMYPDMTCETALNAAIFGGFEPVLVDVESASSNLSVDAAASRLRNADDNCRIRVIVATHIYGNLLEIDKLRAIIRDPDVFILEDAAQAHGGALNGKKAGSMGDASIVSFGTGKNIDCGGGGAILTDSLSIANRCRRIRDTLPADDLKAQSQRSDFMKDFYLLCRDRNQTGRQIYDAKNILKRRYREGFVYRIREDLLAPIHAGIMNSSRLFDERRRAADRWKEAFSDFSCVSLPPAIGDPIHWRYTVHVDGIRDQLYQGLVSENISATRFFSPLHRNYGLDDNEFQIATRNFEMVLNFSMTIPQCVISRARTIFSMLSGEPRSVASLATKNFYDLD